MNFAILQKLQNERDSVVASSSADLVSQNRSRGDEANKQNLLNNATSLAPSLV
jgi:hypothetical protein